LRFRRRNTQHCRGAQRIGAELFHLRRKRRDLVDRKRAGERLAEAGKEAGQRIDRLGNRIDCRLDLVDA